MASDQARKRALKSVKRIVVKVGSSILADPEGGLQDEAFRSLARSFVKLVDAEKFELILVSSGSIACGMKKLGFATRPHLISELQACAASGQSSLMQAYEKAFAKRKLMVAQLLLTRDDLQNRRRYLNVKHTLNELLKRGVIPIVNENDTVAVEEIKVGDNDTLAAYVASLSEADLLMLLTDCDGLHTGDPRHDNSATRVSVVTDIDQQTLAMARGAAWETRVGGMLTKLEAARIAGQSGVPTVIADGSDARTPDRVLKGQDCGTLFIPSQSRSASHEKLVSTTSPHMTSSPIVIISTFTLLRLPLGGSCPFESVYTTTGSLCVRHFLGSPATLEPIGHRVARALSGPSVFQTQPGSCEATGPAPMVITRSSLALLSSCTRCVSSASNSGKRSAHSMTTMPSRAV